nr:MazG nucleotide pyrophosphohydrolase domain-containing protein [Ardenticatena sp.]
MDPLALVREFHERFDVEIADHPTIPPAHLRELRLRLIQEEMQELCDAAHEEDLPAIARELADLIYVCYGMALVYGIPIHDVFAEVHASNMSKLGPDGHPIRREDGKVLKGPNFRPPHIAHLLHS